MANNGLAKKIHTVRNNPAVNIVADLSENRPMSSELSKILLERFLNNSRLTKIDTRLAKSLGTNLAYLKQVKLGKKGFKAKHMLVIKQNWVGSYPIDLLINISEKLKEKLDKSGKEIQIQLVDKIPGKLRNCSPFKIDNISRRISDAVVMIYDLI
jgi:hypothetical protein